MSVPPHEDPRAPARGGRSPLLFVFLTVFIDLLGFGMVIPLLPVYSKAYGASETGLGLLFGSFSAMQFVFAPMWGRLSDRIGRKPVLVGGLLGTAGSYVLFGLSDSMGMLFASRVLAGFFGANISTAQAYIADVTAPEDRARGMGLIGAAFGLGFTFGPLLGGAATAISPGAPGFLAAGLSLAAAAFGARTLVEPPRELRSGSRIFGAREVRVAAGDARIGVLYALSYLFIFAFSCFESMFTRFGIERFPEVFHVTASSTPEQLMREAAPIAGLYLCGIGLVSAAIQGGLIRRLVPRFGETTLVVAGPLILAVSFAVVGLAPSWGIVIAGCAILPLGFGLNNPALSGLISRATPQREQGAYLGLNQSVLSLSRATGPLFAGYVFHRFGPASPFLSAALVLVGAAGVAALYRARFGASFARPGGARATEG